MLFPIIKKYSLFRNPIINTHYIILEVNNINWSIYILTIPYLVVPTQKMFE